MNKLIRLLFLIIILLLIAGGVFYWKNQQDVADLNKELPEGMRVKKTLTGDYVVVNKINGYQFKVPEEWEGLSKAIYKDITKAESSIGEALQEKIIFESYLLIEGTRPLDGMELRVLKFADSIDLNTFVEQFKEIYMPSRKTEISEFFPQIEDFIVENLKGLKLSTLLRSKHGSEMVLSDQYYFFKKDLKIYIIMHFDDEFVREFIANGKW